MSHKKGKKIVKKQIIPKQPTLEQLCPVAPLSQAIADQFKLVADLSNARGAVAKDISDKEMAIKQLNDAAIRIGNGNKKGPLMQQILPGLYDPLYDRKEAVKRIRANQSSLKLVINIARGQLPHRYDEYVDALILFRNKLNEVIGDAKLSDVASHRSGTKPAEEKVIFEKSFDDFVEKETKKEPKK